MSRDVMQQALAALENNTTDRDSRCTYCGQHHCSIDCEVAAAIEALRAELAKPETKPIGWGHLGPHGWSYSHVKGVMHNVPLSPPTGAKP